MNAYFLMVVYMKVILKKMKLMEKENSIGLMGFAIKESFIKVFSMGMDFYVGEMGMYIMGNLNTGYFVEMEYFIGKMKKNIIKEII